MSLPKTFVLFLLSLTISSINADAQVSLNPKPCNEIEFDDLLDGKYTTHQIIGLYRCYKNAYGQALNRIYNLERILKEKDKIINEKDKIINEKNKIINELKIAEQNNNQTEIDSLNGIIDDLNTDLAKKSDVIIKLEDDLAKEKEKTREAEEKAFNLQQQEAKLEGIIDSLNHSLDLASSQNRTNQQLISQLKTQLEKAENAKKNIAQAGDQVRISYKKSGLFSKHPIRTIENTLLSKKVNEIPKLNRILNGKIYVDVRKVIPKKENEQPELEHTVVVTILENGDEKGRVQFEINLNLPHSENADYYIYEGETGIKIRGKDPKIKMVRNKLYDFEVEFNNELIGMGVIQFK